MGFCDPLPYGDAESEAHSGLQEEFGERWAHIPMTPVPNRDPKPDPKRNVVFLSAVFDWESRAVRLGLKEMDVSSRDPQVTFNICHLTQPVRQGDLLKRCRDDLLFYVQSTAPDSESGLLCELLQWGNTPT